MRNIFYLFLIFCSLNTLSQEQIHFPIIEIEPVKLIATYSLSWQEDSLNPGHIRKENMLLFLGNTCSGFISDNYYRFDTIIRGMTSRAELNKAAADLSNPLPMSAILYRIFKNYPKEDVITVIEHTLDGTFRYEETLKLFSWQLTSDTTTISGFKVQQATCNFAGRDWIAWFSPDIPYNDGPYKFNGLPGLIVKIYDTRKHYTFELVSVERPEQNLMIDYLKKQFLEGSKQDLFRMKDAFRQNIVVRAKAAGIKTEGQQRAASNMSKRNNPIELKRK